MEDFKVKQLVVNNKAIELKSETTLLLYETKIGTVFLDNIETITHACINFKDGDYSFNIEDEEPIVLQIEVNEGIIRIPDCILVGINKEGFDIQSLRGYFIERKRN